MYDIVTTKLYKLYLFNNLIFFAMDPKLVEFEYTYDFTLKSIIYHYNSQMKPGGSASTVLYIDLIF